MKTIVSFDAFNEKNRWIQKAITHPGSLKKSLGKKKGEKLTKSDINSELSKLRKKDKDPNKPGAQLSKRDATKKRRLELAKTLMKFKEDKNVDNYNFFKNLNQIKDTLDSMLEIDENVINDILNQNQWISDYISGFKGDIERIYNTVQGETDQIISNGNN